MATDAPIRHRGQPLIRAGWRPLRSRPDAAPRPILEAMRRRDLLTQVLVVNLLLIVAAVVAAAIAANPDPTCRDAAGRRSCSGFAVALTIARQRLLLQRRFQPLERLVDQMERADLSRPGANLTRAAPTPGGPEEVAAAAPGVRRACSSGSRPSAGAPRARRSTAQEEERARVARDLHDEVNQSLTGLLLRLEAAREKAPPELAARARPRSGRSPTRRWRSCSTLARQLRPTALDDLGLKAALAGNVRAARPPGRDRASFDAERRARRAARRRPAGRLPRRPGGALERDAPRGRRARRTSACIARATGSSSASPTTAAGSPSTRPAAGSASAGMRERALLVGGDFTIESRPGIGTRVRLLVPIEDVVMRLATADEDVRVLIADDHGIVRSGLRMLLEQQEDIEVIAEAADGADGPRPRDPRAPRPGDPRRQDAEADRPAGDARDPRAGARRLRPDPLDVRRRALPVRGAEGRRLRLRAQDPGRRRPARGGARGRARRAVPHPGGAAGADQGRPRPGRRARPTSSPRASRRS